MASTCLLIAPTSAIRSDLAGIASPCGLFNRWFSAVSGEEALTLLDREAIDLVLLSGSSSGRELRQLCRRAADKDIPLIVCGCENVEERIRALTAGATDALPRQISPREAVLRLRRRVEVKHRLDELRRDREELSRQALTDSLTGLGNRRSFQQHLAAEGARSARNGEPFALMMIDLDYFKKINDTFGHPTGDRVLQKVAGVLRHGVRRSDMAFRIGGEEFILLLPGTTAENANILAGKLRQRLATACRDILPPEWPVTVSIGISCTAGPGPVDLERMQAEADRGLYAAKVGGRNRVVFARPASPPGATAAILAAAALPA